MTYYKKHMFNVIAFFVSCEGSIQTREQLSDNSGAYCALHLEEVDFFDRTHDAAYLDIKPISTTQQFHQLMSI